MVHQNCIVFLTVLSVFGLTVNAELEHDVFISSLDHFQQEKEQIPMNYVANNQHASEDGPIFIQIQEGDRSTTEYLTSGLMYDIAAEQGASLITFDLRFFHNNLITDSASTANLRFLTVDQIIHDIVALIDHLRPNNATSPVILFGRGFGATLATWTQRQFPGLVAGVWSSSGRQLTTGVHTSQPIEHLAATIERVGGAPCAERVYEAFESMGMYMSWEAEAHVQYFYELCTVPDRRYAGELSAVFAGITQLIADQINREHSAAIHGLCAELNAVEEFAMHGAFLALADWVQRHTPGRRGCLDTAYLQRVRANSQTDWQQVWRHSWADNVQPLVKPQRSRPAQWLACTQLGGALTTQAIHNSTFGNQVGQDLFFGHCSAFGARPSADYDYARLAGEVEALWQRLASGGNGTDRERVVFTNGELDAWFGFGQQKADHAGQVVINIANYGASADLESHSEADSVELAAAKQQIHQTIVSWLA